VEWTVIHLAAGRQIAKNPPRRVFHMKKSKLTDKPRSFHREGSGQSFILRRTPDSKKPAEAGFSHEKVETDR